jgi:LPS-assembly protein
MSKGLVWVLSCLVFCCFCCGLAGAEEQQLMPSERFQGGPWWIRAEKITYNSTTHIYEASGRVDIRQEERRLSADHVQVNEVTKVASLQGNVVMLLGEDILSGKEGAFNLATRSGEMQEARLFLKRNNFHVEGPLIRKTGDTSYYAESSLVTTCDADRPMWSFSARNLSVVMDGYAVGHDNVFRLAGVPVLYLPYSLMPVKTERQSGFLFPSYGQHKAGGTIIELPFYWAISDFADATFYQTVLSNRGYMQGAEYRSKGYGDTASNFRFFYLNDGSGEAPVRNRYWAAGMVNQPLADDWNLRLTGDRVSDANYLADFNFGYMGLNRYNQSLLQDFGRDLEQEEVPERVSTLMLSRNFPWANFTGYSRYYQRLRPSDPRPFNRVPGMSLYSIPVPLAGLPLSLGLDTSYTYFIQEHGMAGDRLDFHPVLFMQTQPLTGLDFSSRVGFRETMFRIDHSTPGNPPENVLGRQLFDAKISLGSALSKDYGRNDADDNQFYRHILRPEITYWNMPRYDANRYPGFDPFDLGWVVRANRNMPVQDGDDPLGGVNALTYGLSSNILWRDRNPQSQATVRDVIWFRLGQSAFFNKSSMGLDGTNISHHKFSDFLGEAEYYPFRQLVLGGNLGVSPYQDGVSRANVKLIFLDSQRQDLFNVNYLFIKDFASQINAMTYLNLLESVKSWVTFSHTFQTNKNLERRYGLVLQRQCWGMVLSYTERPDDKRIGFTVYIPGLGDKMSHSPVRFTDDVKGARGAPDLF